MTATNATSLSSGLPAGNINRASNRGGIRLTIDMVSAPSSEPTSSTKVEGESSTDEKTGTKVEGQEAANQPTTVRSASEANQAVRISTESVLRGLAGQPADQTNKNPVDAWKDTGAQAGPRSLASILGQPEIPSSNRGQILNDFDALRNVFDIRNPSNLVGSPADPSQALASTAQGAGQSIFGSGNGALNQQPGGGGQGGTTNLFVSSNSQAQAVGGGGASIGPQVVVAEVTTTPSGSPGNENRAAKIGDANHEDT